MPTRTSRIASIVLCVFLLSPLVQGQTAPSTQPIRLDALAIDHDRMMEMSNGFLNQPVVTVTASHSPRSAGGEHDFFSEADYFWPDPKNPGGPYKERDGVTNPDNFLVHRKAMIRFSKIIGALASAYKLTGD